MRRFALRLFALPVAIAIIGVIGFAAWSDMPDSTIPHDGSTVPAVAPAVACADGWVGFDNPVLRYTLCYPRAWGFSSFTSSAPLTELLTRSLHSLHLLSAGAFPWQVGRSSFDAVAAGALDIEVDGLPAGVSTEGECAPAPLDAPLPCEVRYDALGQPSAAGVIRAIKIAVPLTGADVPVLQVVVRAPVNSEEVDLAWDVVRSITAY
jgi:hypothetical protein